MYKYTGIELPNEQHENYQVCFVKVDTNDNVSKTSFGFDSKEYAQQALSLARFVQDKAEKLN